MPACWVIVEGVSHADAFSRLFITDGSQMQRVPRVSRGPAARRGSFTGGSGGVFKPAAKTVSKLFLTPRQDTDMGMSRGEADKDLRKWAEASNRRSCPERRLPEQRWGMEGKEQPGTASCPRAPLTASTQTGVQSAAKRDPRGILAAGQQEGARDQTGNSS